MRRALLRIAAAVAGVLLVIEIGARWNIHRERLKRARLGDHLYAEVAGDHGDPIVFIAGLQGSTRYWSHAFDDLSRDHRVIAVDLLGFGRSPWPADVEYTLDDHLTWLHRTLASLGATRNVTIVAHSFGTVIAAHYAARYPGEVARLVLLGTPVYDSEREARRRIWAMSPLAALFSLQPVIAREACLAMEVVRPLLTRAMPRLMSRLPRAAAEDALLHTWWSFRGAMQNVLLTKPIAIPLREVGAKTILVHGTRDGITPLSRIRTLAAQTGAAVRVLDCDHHGYVREARAEVARVLRKNVGG